ncbi:telomerase reverse transcriptase-like [Danaus plexippus]|uniref:telomerase reverse transcriptase-like n=1 Tax=Danaus plexippus TaxID=13037 RepID=UPI002AB1D973|nr:telomerase reverse transcriptase-like [Danaus plexippus]
MDIPICFSHNFSSKQNVRSIKNVINLKFLKSGEDIFLQHIIEDKSVLREISIELREIMKNLKENIVTYSKNDFKEYFVKTDDDKYLHSVNKSKLFIGCWAALLKIVPDNFYGNNHNSKLFKKIVKTVIYSMNRQHFNFRDMINGWHLLIYPWNTLTAAISFKVLHYSLLWILKKLLSSIIVLNFYVTTCKTDADENKLHYFWKNVWQSFYDKKISIMTTTRIIKKIEPYSLGNKIKIRYSYQQKIRLKNKIKEIPKLHLILKQNNDCRPIVRYKNDKTNLTSKNKIKEQLYFLRKLSGKPQEKIENKYLNFFKKWEIRNKPKLYFVKTDLSNAFGSINRQKLLKILIERHENFQKAETSLYLKKKIAQTFKDFIAELKNPLLVRSGSTVYEWKEGLVQGYKYSPALSEIYYSYLDDIYFRHHINITDDLKLFIRVVDDYLYITDSLQDAYDFLKALSNYRNVNYNKTVVNFPNQSIKVSDEIVFLGYSYDTKTLHVSRANSVNSGQMCFKIGFSLAIADLGKFLENRIGQSGIEINGHIFNFYYNSEQLIWQHVFVTLCLSANKFCTILSILCNESDMFRYMCIYKRKVTVKLCNTIIDTLHRNKPEGFMFIFCINHFRYLSYKALLLCAQKTPKCNKLVPYINVEMAKTNCLYGKWREHSRRMSKNGCGLRQAIKEVCRRSDLRAILKNYDVLPEGLRCFDRKNMYV